MEASTEAQTAGAKALAEIKKAALELIEVFENRELQERYEDETLEETVMRKMNSIIGKYEGTYWYNGHNGWKSALQEPDAEPFDAANW
jgi:hypothetical protein